MSQITTTVISQLNTLPAFAGSDVFNTQLALQYANQPNAAFLQVLMADALLLKHLFIQTGEAFVFNKEAFEQAVLAHNYLKHSTTFYQNKIGLATTKQFVKNGDDVVLAWPYKDGTLAGGQSKDEEKRNEKIFHQTIEAAEIDKLLSPKAFKKISAFAQDGSAKDIEFTGSESLLIQGNNLIALHSLGKVYAGKIQLIYIDPPYNTGKDSFSYNDRFTHSTWLTFMKNRLEIARKLLAPNGSIFVHLDHNEAHYCKVLMDEIFGRNHFINEIVWCYTGPGSPGMRQFNRKHDTILWYSNGNQWTFNADDIRVPSNVHSGGFKGEMNKASSDTYSQKGKIPEDWWEFAVASRFKVDGKQRTGYNTEKPFKLIERIIKTASNAGDIVLDFFGGSATTAWVAAKLNRRFITVEQMADTVIIAKKRLSGHCAFTYLELAQMPGNLVEQLANATTNTQLLSMFKKIRSSPYIHYSLTEKQIVDFEKNALNLPFEECYAFVVASFDTNNMYVGRADMMDRSVGVTNAEVKLTNAFYDQIIKL